MGARVWSPRLGVALLVMAGACAGAFATAGGCASAQPAAVAQGAPNANENSGLPAWFVEREGKLAAAGKPDLSAVPKNPPDAMGEVKARLDQMEAELKLARQMLVMDPRAAEPPVNAAAESFDRAARDAVEQARR